MDDAELTFPYDRLTRFKDMEGVGRVVANPKSLRARYLTRIQTVRRHASRRPASSATSATTWPTPRSLTTSSWRRTWRSGRGWDELANGRREPAGVAYYRRYGIAPAGSRRPFAPEKLQCDSPRSRPLTARAGRAPGRRLHRSARHRRRPAGERARLLEGGPALLRAAEEAAARPNAVRHPAAGVKLLPPIPDPPKIICIGLNYRDHAAETGRRSPASRCCSASSPPP